MSRQDGITAVVDLLVIAGLAVAVALVSWLFLLPAAGWFGVLVWQVRIGRRAALLHEPDL